jgi:hypothetical protein
MRIISHRGNLNGPDKTSENSIDRIIQAIDQGFDVEIDVRVENDQLWLGHDVSEYLVSRSFLIDNRSRLWLHLKNFEAVKYFSKNLPHLNFFWHQNDDYTLTSAKYIWTYPRKNVCDRSIIVALDPVEIFLYQKSEAAGICTDYPMYLKEELLKLGVEKRYTEYVYNCACVEETALSFREFMDAISNGKCEICLVHPEEKCSCKNG